MGKVGMGRKRRRGVQIVGIAFTILGATILLAVGGFYVYAAYAESQLGELTRKAPASVYREPTPARPAATATPTVSAASPAGPPASPAPSPAIIDVPLKPLVTPTPTAAPPPPKRIMIPDIDVDARVVPVTTVYEDGKLVWATASHAVGHHDGSASPGEPSNIVMSGHISSPLKGEGSVFKRLPQLKPEAEVVLYTEKKVYRYRVVETFVIKPEQIEVMDPTPYPILTLITCVPDWVYSNRLIIRAEPVSQEDNVHEPPFNDDPKKHP